MTIKRSLKKAAIGSGFAALSASRLHRAFAPLTAGQGAVLMFHHVRPTDDRTGFAPNASLEIQPGFLDAVLGHLRRLDLDIVTMDEAVRRIDDARARRFVALTFDDGYRDCVDHALPILQRHGAPFTLYVTTGFADRTARLWWVELERACRALPRLDVTIDGARLVLQNGDAAEKAHAFETLYWRLRAGPEARLLDTIATLTAEAAIDPASIADELCLDWDGIRALARHPLCTIGVHTLTHPMLAKHPADRVRDELAESRRRIETEIGLPARHLAYPVGDPGSAGPRDYAIARDLGFASAVTTRPGMIFPGQAAHLTALPRLSVNGAWQTIASLDVLLSGLPFALWNRGRRIAR